MLKVYVILPRTSFPELDTYIGAIEIVSTSETFKSFKVKVKVLLSSSPKGTFLSIDSLFSPSKKTNFIPVKLPFPTFLITPTTTLPPSILAL